MKLMNRQNKTISKGTIMSYKELDIIFFGATIKNCFRQCTEKEFYKSPLCEKLGSQSFEYAICVIPVNYIIEVRY